MRSLPRRNRGEFPQDALRHRFHSLRVVCRDGIDQGDDLPPDFGSGGLGQLIDPPDLLRRIGALQQHAGNHLKPLLLAVPTWILFEIGLLIAARQQKRREAAAAAELDDAVLDVYRQDNES